jgi:hypothetical protein
MRAGQSESVDAQAAWRFPVKERYRLHWSYDAGEAERAKEEQQNADESWSSITQTLWLDAIDYFNHASSYTTFDF